MIYDSVIGIGGNCEVAKQLRRYMSTESAHIFDWWIAPFDGTIALLDNDFSDIFDASNMEIIGDRKAVRCRKYGIIHHHDFRRDEKKRVLTEEIEEQLDDQRNKYQALKLRLENACASDSKVLFVRSWREILHEPKGYPKHLIPGVPRYDFRRFVEALRRRFPDADISVLFVNYGDQKIDMDGVYFDNVKDHGDIVDWEGSRIGWRELLARHVSV